MCHEIASPPAFSPLARDWFESSLGARFEAQVDLHRERLAVKTGPAALSYAELNACANRIAHALLRARGAAPEPVAILVDQGPLLVAAILGVLKAGKFYVPLEAGHPRERLTHMLRDSTARCAVVGPAAAALLAEIAPGVARIPAEVAEHGPDAGNPALAVPPEGNACIYYTTGSTGEPKGVLDSHRNVLHNVWRYTNALAITHEDRLTLLQSASFSGAVSSLFGALLNGAASFPIDVRGSTPAQLAACIADERITMTHSVPTIFRSFAGGSRVFDSVRAVRLEGDLATALDVELFRRHFGPRCVLSIGLGTTETGLIRRFVVAQAGPPIEGIVPIGHAVEDMEVFITGDDLRPLPPGEAGEIMVRSRYLASGYWNRPQATAQAFAADAGPPPSRVYRTGDLGRMRADGCLEYLGRRHALVKIRGTTVALAEVEAALQALPGVREGVVVDRTDARGERRLVAFYVPCAGAEPTTSELRRGLSAVVAPPMVPSAFVPLDRLPLNENLKVDRGRLPPTTGQRPRLAEPYVAPRDPTEAALVHVWQDLLGVSPVGVRDDFFDLGGDSLSATAMADAAEQALGVALPASALLGASTVEGLATQLAGARQWPASVALQDGGARPRLFFLHGDYVGGGLYCRELARALGAEQPFCALTPCGLDGQAAPSSIEEMAERHLGELRRVQPHGPYLLGGHCNGGLVALEMARRLVESGESVERLIVVRSSAGNVRFARLRVLAERWAGRTGAAAARGRALVRRGRWFVEAWEAARGVQRCALVLRKLRAVVMAIVGRLRGDAPAARARREGQAALSEVFMDAAADHVPLPYPGPITVLWPEQEPQPMHEALESWRRVSPSVTIEAVPGDHLTALTVHVQELARHLARHLPGRGA